jgi:hypothetical protein
MNSDVRDILELETASRKEGPTKEKVKFLLRKKKIFYN